LNEGDRNSLCQIFNLARADGAILPGMPKVSLHPPGTFCWIELATSDQSAAKDFYGSLFAWAVRDFPMGPNEFYSIFQIDGADAGAAYTLRPDQQAQHVPPHWLLYIAVADADETAKKTAELGGTVFAPPFDVSDFGRMAVLADPAGAVFAIWQAKSHRGMGLAGVAGSLCWADLQTPDREKASAFYGSLFGWEFTLGKDKDPSGYLHIKCGEEFIGGIPPAQHAAPNAPPSWLIYILVSDCAASTRRAENLGARTLLAPLMIEGAGQMSVLADPQGAVFATFQLTR
jgi:predicted enzyme related to lactoylglutathione lyase